MGLQRGGSEGTTRGAEAKGRRAVGAFLGLAAKKSPIDAAAGIDWRLPRAGSQEVAAGAAPSRTSAFGRASQRCCPASLVKRPSARGRVGPGVARAGRRGAWMSCAKRPAPPRLAQRVAFSPAIEGKRDTLTVPSVSPTRPRLAYDRARSAARGARKPPSRHSLIDAVSEPPRSRGRDEFRLLAAKPMLALDDLRLELHDLRLEPLRPQAQRAARATPRPRTHDNVRRRPATPTRPEQARRRRISDRPVSYVPRGA